MKRKPGENGQAEWGKQENNSTRLAFVLQVDCSMQEQLARRKDSVECRALCAEHAPKRPIVCPEIPCCFSVGTAFAGNLTRLSCLWDFPGFLGHKSDGMQYRTHAHIGVPFRDVLLQNYDSPYGKYSQEKFWRLP